MTYNKNSFNKDANFTSVVFGSDKPLLEAELNELQSIQHNKSTETIKAIYGDGVIGKGNYSYTANTFSLNNEYVLLNGNLITIDSVSILANSGDSIYLQSWIEEVTCDSTLKKYGNESSTTNLTNNIKDARYNIETSRRGQLKYKLSTSEDLSKYNLKLGRIVNNTFVLDCPVVNNLTNHYETVTGNYINIENAKDGQINLEVLGNTVQNPSNLADIKSVGRIREDNQYEIKVTSQGTNLLNLSSLKLGVKIDTSNGTIVSTDNSYFVLTDFVKVDVNRLIRIRSKHVPNLHCVEYDSNFNFIQAQTQIQTSSVRVSSNCKYIRVYGYSTSLSSVSSSQLSELVYAYHVPTTQSPVLPQEPYQGRTSKVTLPCQLEKIGEACDRLFRREDGVWCIEKKIQEITLNGTENWSANGSGNSYRILLDLENLAIKTDGNVLGNIMSTKFPTVSYNDMYNGNVTKGIAVYNVSSKVALRNNDITSLVDFKSYLQANNIKVKYEAIVPQVIELSLDNQIQLNSYFGTTQVCIDSGEIEGTIKCIIPKSIGASINSLNSKADSLDTRVQKIETLQKGSQISIASQKQAVVVPDSNEGYITNVKVEGNTLVNLATVNRGSFDFKSSTPSNGLTSALAFSTNKKFTICLNLTTNTLDTDIKILVSNKDESVKIYPTTIPRGTTGIYTCLIEPLKNGVYNSIDSVRLYTDNSTTGSVTFENLMILEDDYTKNPPSYFVGLLSTGQDVEMMKLESNNGGNIFTGSYQKGYRLGTNGAPFAQDEYSLTDFINITEGLSYYANIYSTLIYVGYYDKNKNLLRRDVLTANEYNATLTPPLGAKYLRYSTYTQNLSNLSISVSKNNTNNIVTSTKQLLYKTNNNTFVPIPSLRGIDTTIKDTIELHSDGNYYFHKRCEEVILEGSEGWILDDYATKFDTSSVFTCILDARKEGFKNIVSNKFLTSDQTHAQDIESISGYSNTNKIRIRIPKTKLTTADVKGFVEWLKANPVTLVYQLATEKVYECANIDLNTFDEKTIVQINSGSINPYKTSFNATSHIGNVINTMKEKVDKNTKFREEMEESVTLTREFETGYEVFEDTKESSVTINKIEGNTLVNLLGKPTNSTSNASYTSDGVITFNQATTTTGVNHRVIFDNALVYPNKTYTLVFTVTKNTLTNTASSENVAKFNLIHNGSGNFYLKRGVTGRQIVVLTQPSESTGKAYIEVLGTCTGELVIRDCYVLEEDQTALLPSYFEGLKSVGDSQPLEIQSRKEDGNIFNNDLWELGFIGDSTGIFSDSSTYLRTPIQFVQPDTTYTFEGYTQRIYYYDALGNYISRNDLGGGTLNRQSTKFTTPSNCRGIALRYEFKNSLSKVGSLEEMKLSKTSIIKDGGVNEFKQNKKQILYQTKEGNYEKPILRSTGIVSDTIEKHSDGKYYFHKRCEEKILTGSESWSLIGDYSKFVEISNLSPTPLPNQSGVCDKLPPGKNIGGANATNPIEIGVYGLGQLRLKPLAKSDMTLEEAKSWLQSNNVTYVYAMAIEEVYECVNLDLDSYEGETSILFPSVIPAKVKASVGSNLLATIENLKDRVHSLETGLSDMTENGSGWCKLPNGMIMQWGETYYQDLVKDVWVDKKITLPITLKKCLSVFVTTNGHSRGANRYFHVMKLSNDVATTNTIDVSLITGTNSTWGGVNYLVFGYC